MPISVDEDGAGFVIRQTDEAGMPVSEMKVTGLDVLNLAQSAQQLRTAALRAFQPAGWGHGAVLATVGVSVQLNDTSLGEALLLTLGAPNGAETTYSLRPEVALHLSERLAARAAQLPTQKPNQ